MAYSNLEGVLISAQTLTASFNSSALETRNVSAGSLALVWSAAAATDAVVKLQESMDGTTWFDIASMTVTIGAATGSKKFALSAIDMPYLRAVCTANTETAAILTLKYYLKGDR